MKTLLVAIAAVLVVVGGTAWTPGIVLAQAPPSGTGWANPDDIIQGEWRIPRSHRYEAPKGGTWQVVQSTEVPGLLGQGLPVFDRSTELMVVDQNHAKNPLYLASTYTSTSTSTSGTQTAGNWEKIHGHVQSMQGTQLTFRADDGRTLNVDTSQVSPTVRSGLTPNEGALLVGHATSPANSFQARWIQQDSSNPAYGGHYAGHPAAQAPAPAPSTTASATGPVNQKAWQRLHGHVQSVSGSTMSFKADDGKTLTVDVSKVSPSVVRALTPGEGATVTGHYQQDQNHIAAQYIQQDRTQGAASPKTK